LLIDTGDAIAGSPLSAHAMAKAMNELGYDAMVLGNHDFDDREALAAFVAEARFPVLSANIESYSAAIIKDVCGVKVAVLGLTTSSVAGASDALAAAKRKVPLLKADRVVVAIHAGPDKQPKKADDWNASYTDDAKWIDRGNLPGENQAVQIAQQVPGIDLVLSGHTHQVIPEMKVGKIALTQPNRWGSHLSMSILGGHSQLFAVDASVPEDPVLVDLVKTEHEAALAAVEAPVGTTTAAFEGGNAARFTDSALADLINVVQMEMAAKAGFPVDASAAAIVTDGLLPAGVVKLRDVYSVYLYDNTLWVIEVTGAVLRAALEKDAAYFATLDPAALPADAEKMKAFPGGPSFNWDLYSGFDYTLDVTKPVGSRVVRLSVKPEQLVRIALNNFRATGGGGYGMFRESKVRWRSTEGVREALAEYVRTHPGLDPAQIGTCNFKLVPRISSLTRCP